MIDVILYGPGFSAAMSGGIDVVLGAGGPMGEPAVQSIGFGWAGTFQVAEDLGGITHSGSATYRSVRWSVKAAPVADATFALQKNGSAFVTVTVPAGETEGIEDIGTSSVADGDRLDWTAPSPAEGALQGFSPTLSSLAA